MRYTRPLDWKTKTSHLDDSRMRCLPLHTLVVRLLSRHIITTGAALNMGSYRVSKCKRFSSTRRH